MPAWQDGMGARLRAAKRIATLTLTLKQHMLRHDVSRAVLPQTWRTCNM